MISTKKLLKKCKQCNKIFKNPKNLLFCNRECYKLWLRDNKEKHYNYKEGKTLKKYYCIDCGKEINWQTGTKGEGRCRSCAKKSCPTKNNIKNKERHIIHYCKELNCNNLIGYATWKNGSGKCKKCSAKGRNKGIKRSKKTRSLISLARGGTGIPYENGEYPEEFFKIRPTIRKRDNYTCQNKDCNKVFDKRSRKLQVHHIDYNKQNNNPDNLLCLCNKCNITANFNREYWKSYYQKNKNK